MTSHAIPGDSRPQPAGASDFNRSQGAQLQRVELLSIWVAWGLVALLLCVSAVMNPNLFPGNSLLEPIIGSITEACLWALMTPLIFKLAAYLTLDHPRWLIHLVCLLLIGLALSLTVFALMSYIRIGNQWLLRHLFDNYRSGESQQPMSLFTYRLWQLYEFAVFLVILTAGIAKDYLSRYRLYQQRLTQANVELAQAKLRTLQNQLNPHFLFNTLNAVSSLISTQPRSAQDVLAQLSDLLRETLASKELEVSLSKELELVSRYMEIMHARYGDHLQFTTHIEPGIDNAMLPTLILQPLIENAIQHGIEGVSGHGSIQLLANKVGQQLSITVTNTSQEQSPHEYTDFRRPGGIGLSNTRERLEQAYGSQQSLQISRHDHQTHVNMLLPFHTAALAE